MRKILAYPLTILYFLIFGIILLVFHPIQWICLKGFGYNAHKKSVSILNLVLIWCTYILGTRYTFINKNKIPENKPLIIVSNHQSMNDIPPIIWHMRQHHPKFVSKIELGKGIPSVSFNLRHGGSVLIDRKDSKQALAAIAKLGEYIEEFNRSAVIFPEGTRSRTGQPKKFQTTGLKVLIKKAPSALIVPISINNSWKMLRYGKFPYGIGSHLIFKVHPPIPNTGDPEAIIARAEELIKQDILTHL
ncbi:1-acyl-sn-glycerol-3-phosphate acyltransferase [Muriicola jejuensis]|uniref:1-acyl-sn-glycerol-3-phosphate acyltransferase n=1 Tax=Muriicola jejuensis TaxID=504488 RepID=A0A6P0U987_9FLAO|nr:lysophospholipid acyltransferase family protein [Muriicola jejuensis]NER09785.1 1-acyl-sn-glycerol-3-phosphate acyltransferase [Muriicola jejuensis]SMP05790.1 1-acyl-sn-glycerol-3-phosphate acyltransferase [Muriicola jejuensis]